MTPTQLADALDDQYGNPLAKGNELILQAIAMLRKQAEEIAALQQK